MALWDVLKESIAKIQAALLAKKHDLKGAAFRDASMAICALVTAADGKIDPAERQRVAKLITTNEVLQHFPAEDLRQLYEANLERLAADFDFGKVAVLQEIAKTKEKPVEARATIQIGIVIGGADGTFGEEEKNVIRESCYAVGLLPYEFDL